MTSFFVSIRNCARNDGQFLQENDGAVGLWPGKRLVLRAATASGQSEEMVAEQETFSQPQGSANGIASKA